MESYTRETHLEKHSSYQPGTLEARLNGGEIIPTTKEEEWTTQKKKINNKTRQVETRVQRKLLMEDGRVIADSGPKVRTRTKEMRDQNDSEDEDLSQQQTKKETFEDRELFEKLKNSPEYIQLPHQDQIFSEKVHRSNKIRECKQENYRFHDEDLKELDALDLHRTATMTPEELLRASTKEQDSFSDDEHGVRDGKFQLSKRNRGKLTHYSAKGYKIVDNDEQREVAEYDEFGQLVKKRYRTHNHELINDDEVPELMYDHERYVKELKEVSGKDFIKIPPADYEHPPVRPVRPLRLKQRSSSLNNLRQASASESYSRQEQQQRQQQHQQQQQQQQRSSNVEFSEEQSASRQSRSRHRSSERVNESSRTSQPVPPAVLTYRDRSESRQSSIINGNFEEKVNIMETETYSNHTDNWLDNHFGPPEQQPSSSRRLKDRYRSSSCDRANMEQRNVYHQRSSYSRASNQDACVQASFESDESEGEIDRLRSSSQPRPARTYFFGERDASRSANTTRTSTGQPLKSALKLTTTRSTTPQKSSNYEQRLNDRFDSMRLFSDRSKELVHPIRVEKDENDNYMYSKQVKKSSYRNEFVEPRWTKIDVRSYTPDFSSPYIRGCSPPPPRERIIPLRTVYSDKPPVYSSYRSLNRSSNLRSSTPSNLRTDFPEFSSLNSPSKIASTLRR